MSNTLRQSAAVDNPLTAIPWYAAYWASDPNWISRPANGSTVTSWPDGVGGRTLISTTGTPVMRTALAAMNNQPAVEINNSSFMKAQDFGRLPLPWVYVGIVTPMVNFQTVFQGSTTSGGSTGTPPYVWNVNGTWANHNTISAFSAATGGASLAEPALILWQLGTTHYFRVNEGTTGTGSGVSATASAGYLDLIQLRGQVGFCGIYPGEITTLLALPQWTPFVKWAKTFYAMRWIP